MFALLCVNRPILHMGGDLGATAGDGLKILRWGRSMLSYPNILDL